MATSYRLFADVLAERRAELLLTVADAASRFDLGLGDCDGAIALDAVIGVRLQVFPP